MFNVTSVTNGQTTEESGKLGGVLVNDKSQYFWVLSFSCTLYNSPWLPKGIFILIARKSGS